MGRKTLVLAAILISVVVAIILIVAPTTITESIPNTIVDTDILRGRSSGVTRYEGRTINLCKNPDGHLADHYTKGVPNGTKNLHTHIHEVYQDNTVSVYIDEKGTTQKYKIRDFVLLDKDFNHISVAAYEFSPGDCVFISSVIVNNKEASGPFSIFKLQ